ncbi:MAG: YlxR family protein [Clostridia bacterium]|nr:YlxR family protein [Clostridia bacterium]
MQQKKQPMRKCVGCGEMFPKKELVRIVKTRISAEGEEEKYEVSLDLTGKKAGRGAYICKNTDCLVKAVKAKRIQKALTCQIPEEVFERMKEEIADG